MQARRTAGLLTLVCLAALAALPAWSSADVAAAAAAGAGCPVASPALAGQPTPGVPTGVRAIPGDTSVTIRWCAPVGGHANVISYTVTSSAGQQTTVPVPNQYVIIDGLTNARPYSFTVRANTASAAGPPSASSNSATPMPVAAPHDVLRSHPESVAYDQYSVTIGAKRTFIYAGEFDPWRLPSPSLGWIAWRR